MRQRPLRREQLSWWAVIVGILMAPALSKALIANAAPVEFTNERPRLSIVPGSGFVSLAGGAPGGSTTEPLTLMNTGRLPLRYAVSGSATNGDAKQLRDQITLTIKGIDATASAGLCDNFDGTALYSGDLDGVAGRILGDVRLGADPGDRTLNADSAETLCFRVQLPLSAGNRYQMATSTPTFHFAAEQIGGA